MTRDEKIAFLKTYGWKVGPRDPRLNMDYSGVFMVCEPYEDDELPTRDGRDGPWCVVGDELTELVETGFDALRSMVCDYTTD